MEVGGLVISIFLHSERQIGHTALDYMERKIFSNSMNKVNYVSILIKFMYKNVHLKTQNM